MAGGFPQEGPVQARPSHAFPCHKVIINMSMILVIQMFFMRAFGRTLPWLTWWKHHSHLQQSTWWKLVVSLRRPLPLQSNTLAGYYIKVKLNLALLNLPREREYICIFFISWNPSSWRKDVYPAWSRPLLLMAWWHAEPGYQQQSAMVLKEFDQNILVSASGGLISISFGKIMLPIWVHPVARTNFKP